MAAVAGFACALVVTAFAGCNHAGRRPAATPEPVTPTAPQEHATAVNPSLKPFVDVAVDDLARRLGVNRDAITVLETRPMVWPDGSLGCPQPGVQYPQVQQDGLLIRLRAQGREFSYHGGGIRKPFLCENSR